MARQQILHSLYKSLEAQFGIRIAPLLVDPEALKHVDQLQPGYQKDLNLSEGYAKTYPSGIRELVQNWRDQSVELSRAKRIIRFHDKAWDAEAKKAARNVGIEDVHIIMIENWQSPMQQNMAPGPFPVPAKTVALPEYHTNKQPFIVGHLITYWSGGSMGVGQLCVDLCNHATVLNPDMFSLGCSEKPGNSYAAGHFGEGMKVQVNRLIVDQHVDVSFVTGPCIWTFKHLCAPHCKHSTLHMCNNRLMQHHGQPSLGTMSQQPSPSTPQETICTITGLKAKPLNNDEYLFLQDPISQLPVPCNTAAVPSYVRHSTLLSYLSNWYPMVSVQEASLGIGAELLFAPHLHGKLFLHGILLQDICDQRGEKEALCFGVNYTGSANHLTTFDFNNNRTFIHTMKLTCWMVESAVQVLNKTPDDRMWCVLAHVFEAMNADLQVFSMFKHGISGNDGSQKLFATRLAELLGPSAGLPINSRPFPFPCAKNASAAVKAELTLLGQHPVPVGETLLGLWSSVPGMLKTMQQLWQERRVEVDAMPDARATWGDAERAEAEELLYRVAGLLAPLGVHLGLPPTVNAMRSCMKVLNWVGSSCYHSQVVITFKPDPIKGSGPLLVIEGEYLKSLESVHNRKRAQGKVCGAGGQCGGNCIQELVLHELMTGLQAMGIHSKAVNECVVSQCLSLVGPNLHKLGTQAAAAPPSSQAAPVHQGPSAAPAAQSPACAHGQPQPSSAASPAPSSTGATTSTTTTTSPAVRFVKVRAPAVGAGPVSNFSTASIAADVGNSLFSSRLAPNQVQGRKQEESGDKEPIEIEDTCGENEQPLLATSCPLGGFGQPGTAISVLYMPEGVAITPSIEAAARQMHSSLRLLLTHVFAAGEHCNSNPNNNRVHGAAAQVAPQFFVYYDPKRPSIAFNRGGELWFNAAVVVDVRSSRNPAYDQARFWFLVVCHELAHNKVKQHNSAFSDACSANTLHFADKFKEFVAQFCGMCG